MSVSLREYCKRLASQAKSASIDLAQKSTDEKNLWLIRSAERIWNDRNAILASNRIDLEQSDAFGLTAAQKDRLELNPSRLQSIVDSLQQIAALPDPVGEVIDHQIRPNGLSMQRVRVPLGVIFFIYESRPNVTADASAICLKSGNAVILRGGKEAYHSSRAIVDRLIEQAIQLGMPEHAVQLVDTPDRNAIDELLSLSGQIDLAIPRGGIGLIQRVTQLATMPVMKHFDGNCHVYVDAQADLSMALEIVVNSKCQRMGVCNACESLLVHRSVASDFLPKLALRLDDFAVEIRGDPTVCEILPSAVPATEEDWKSEYLGPILSAKIVDDVDEAIAHINFYGSHHTDAIVTSNETTSQRFLRNVDSAAVLANASTRFNDGGELGLGAEIGISTDKFHARGPCGLRELTSYKYIIQGSGQTRIQ